MRPARASCGPPSPFSRRNSARAARPRGIDVAEDIRLDSANNRLLVFAGIANPVIAVNLANGNRTEISGANVGQGVPLTALNGGDVDLDRQIAACADVTMNWLVVVDLSNGDRVAFSH